MRKVFENKFLTANIIVQETKISTTNKGEENRKKEKKVDRLKIYWTPLTQVRILSKTQNVWYR